MQNNSHSLISFSNDYLFKKIYASKNTACLKFFIQSILPNQDVQDIYLLNPELPVEILAGKRSYLDIKSKDQQGHLYDMEMQTTPIGINQLNRFLLYGAKLLTGQLKSGEAYEHLSAVDVMIMTTQRYHEQFHVVYTLSDFISGYKMENDKLHYHIISLPQIDQIVQTKKEKHEQLTDLEVLAYVHWRGINEEVKAMSNEKQKKVMAVMEDTRQELYNNPYEFTMAERIALANAEYEQDMFLSVQQGIQRGIKEGRRQEKIKMLANYILFTFDIDVQCSLEKMRLDEMENLTQSIYLAKSKEEIAALFSN